MKYVLAALVFFAAPAFAFAPVQEVKSEHGPTAWLLEDHTLPIVTVKLLFRDAGASQDPEGKAGLASFTAQMMDEGAGDLDSLAFNHALEERAIRFAANASQDTFSVELRTLSKFKDRAFELLTLAISKPRFDAEATARIGASIQSDIEHLQESPGYLASEAWKEKVFPHHPYGHPKRGTFGTIKTITAQDLRDFAAHHLALDRVIVSITGDITSAQVKAWLNTGFPLPLKAQNIVAVPDVKMPLGDAKAMLVERNVPQTVAMATLQAVPRHDPSYYAAYILNYIVGGNTLTSRLGTEIRDKRGLAYYAQSDLEVWDHANFFRATFATRNEETFAALDVLRAILRDTAEKGVTATELDDAKHYLTGSFPLQIDSQGELVEYLTAMQYHHLGIDYLEKRNSYLNAVTLVQVNQAAKTLLAPVPVAVLAGKPQAKKAAP